jgi:hypothetical protein
MLDRGIQGICGIFCFLDHRTNLFRAFNSEVAANLYEIGEEREMVRIKVA